MLQQDDTHALVNIFRKGEDPGAINEDTMIKYAETDFNMLLNVERLSSALLLEPDRTSL